MKKSGSVDVPALQVVAKPTLSLHSSAALADLSVDGATLCLPVLWDIATHLDESLKCFKLRLFLGISVKLRSPRCFNTLLLQTLSRLSLFLLARVYA